MRGASRAFSLRGAGCGWPPRCRTRSPESRKIMRVGGKTPATRADGPSACPGGSPFEKDASTKRRLLRHAAGRKIHRVRNAGEILLPRRVPLALRTPCRTLPKRRAKRRKGARTLRPGEVSAYGRSDDGPAKPFMRAPRARLFAQSFRTPLSQARKRTGRPASPVAGRDTGR